MVVIRENTEGLYSGVGYRHGEHHVNLRVFTDRGMRRIIRFAFDWAVKNGRHKVTFTHKESILRHTDALMKRSVLRDCRRLSGDRRRRHGN